MIAVSEVPEAPGVHAEVHDRHQLEIRFDHAIGSGRGVQTYRMDTYVFIPRNVGVSRVNYTRDQFYADVTALMRIDAPPLELATLARSSVPASPLHALAAALEAVRTAPRPPPSRPIVVHVKLYAYIFAQAVEAELSRLRARVARAAASPTGSVERATLEADVRGSLDRAREALWAYRSVRGAFWPFEQLCHHSLAQAMRNADEFMSLYLEERLARAALDLEREERLLDGTGTAARVRLLLTAYADDEARYRARYGYVSLTEAGLAHADYFNYHLSLLKKAVHAALYLDARASGGDTFIRQTVGAAGASLAAIWALAADVPIKVMSLSGGTKAVVMLAVVLAYVLKDRIKTLTAELLLRRVRKHDHASTLTADSLAAMGLGMLRIRLREAMSWKKSDEVPADIRDLRLSRRTVRVAETATEEVIRYRKEITVDRSKGGERVPEGFRVRDILRLNVRQFLARLDDPLDDVSFFDPERGAFRAARLPKVYHVNIVIRSERSGEGEALNVHYERLRLVLNKEGIVRVDVVEVR
jgi:hypothetical protein